jgi:DNA-binding beta-propeller fold protein YncE
VRIQGVDRRDFLVGAAAVLAAPGTALARHAGGIPVALVTADAESRIGVVELSSGRILRSIPTLPGPRSIEGCREADAIVAHTEEGAVTIVDGVARTVRRVLHGFGEPRYTAVDHRRRLAYVTDSARAQVVVVEVAQGRVLARVGVGGPARHVSVDAAGRRLWTVLGNAAAEIAELDVSRPSRPRVTRIVRPPWPAHDVGFTPGGRRAWVSSGDRRALAILSARSGRVLRTLRGDAPPQHVTFAGDRAYVTSGEDGLLRVHALDGRLRRTTRVPFGSYNVQEGRGLVLSPSLSLGTLSTVRPGGELRRVVQVASSSHDACFVMSL